MTFLDGIYSAADALAAPTFHDVTRVTDVDVAKLVFTIRSRVLHLCPRRGLSGEDGELDAGAPEETQGLLPFLCAASIQGRSALGSEHGVRIERYGIPVAEVSGRAVVIKELCAELGGFSLHAAVNVDAGELSRLEHLCRYITRPRCRTSGSRSLPPARSCWSCALRLVVGQHTSFSSR